MEVRIMQRLAVFAGLCSVLTILSTPETLLAADPAKATVATVRDFGAVGDGQADDTAAIQKAVDAGQGSIRFPRGVYRITRPIVVELSKVGPTALTGDGSARLLMAGPGPAIKLKGTHAGSADPEYLKPDERMPTVEGLEILGVHPEAVGIEADGTMQLTISRVDIRECLHGIHLVRRNRNVLVATSHLYHNRGIGLYLDGVNLHQINVTGCHISYNAGGGIVSRSGDVRNLHIAGCDLECNTSPDQPPTANVLIDCSGDGAGTAEIAITGCTIQHGRGPDAANIRYLGADAKDRRWGHLTIANNVISDVVVNIDLQKARGVSLVGNTFGVAVQHDLRIVDSTNVVVGPNLFDRNPQYKDEKTCNGGVLVQNCQDLTMTGLHITQVRRAPAGLVLEKCQRVNVTGCTILDCDNAGVLLKEVSHSRLSDCLIRNDQAGNSNWTALKTEACQAITTNSSVPIH
jgi:hypothetical protein